MSQNLPGKRRLPGGATSVLLVLYLVGALLAPLATPAHAPVDRAAAATPPMGWDTWNTFGCTINEKLIEQTADAIVSTGLRDAGYRYVVVDDCWFDPGRDAAGNLQANSSRFPAGMKALGDYLHARGLKFGLYESPNVQTCAQRAGAYPGSTGSRGHETQDARQFAAWGVDYLKYDWCSPDGTIDQQLAAFATMRDALAATARTMVFNINPNSAHANTGGVAYWGGVANTWRTTQDITNAWETATGGSTLGVRDIVDANARLGANAAPGGFNDPDMLEVGRSGLTQTEARSHMALWAMMAAPLIAGNDLRTMTAKTLAILGNSILIAIDQDPLARQASEVSNDGTHRVFVKRLSNGDTAVALFNEGDSARAMSTTVSSAGLPDHGVLLRDAWTGTTSRASTTIAATVPAHGTVVFRVSAIG